MLDELRARGFRVGKTRVERLMREHGIRARHKRRFKATTDSKHSLPVAANLLERNTRQAAIADLFEYIEVFYNRSRRHSTLGSRSPVQFMQDWIAAQDRAEQAA